MLIKMCVMVNVHLEIIDICRSDVWLINPISNFKTSTINDIRLSRDRIAKFLCPNVLQVSQDENMTLGYHNGS